MKIAVVGEVNSSNLGDQAIFLGLQSYLNNSNTVVSLDLSGRKSKTGWQNNTKKNVQRNFPGFIYRFYFLITTVIKFLSQIQVISKQIKECQLIIFGGGSLLIDNNLSFPSKLFLFSILSRFHKKKYVVVGCSTRPVLNIIARFMLGYFLNGASKIGLRDYKSLELCEINNRGKCNFTPDSALLLSPSTVDGVGRVNNSKIVGINVMSPQKHGFFSDIYEFEKYMAVIKELASRLVGCKVIIFTTGDFADNDFVTDRFAHEFDVFIPHSLDDLTDFFSSVDRVYATRLHALIISISQGIIPYSLAWDDKITGFIDTYELSDFSTDLRMSRVDIADMIDYSKRPMNGSDTVLVTDIKNDIKYRYDLFFGDLC